MFFRYKTKFISDIEQKNRKLLVNIAVAPFVGVWIEMVETISGNTARAVAPFVGVWIEIHVKEEKEQWKNGRSLRGSVD